MEAAARAGELLRARGLTLATAESLTGGQLAATFTSVPGISAVYVGGAVTYWTEFKQSLLGVSEEIVDTVGVVSAACAEAMATGVRGLAGATYALSTTGVAGPDPQEGKPVGTVFVGIAGPGGVRAVQLALSGTRAEIQAQTCAAAVDLLIDALGD
ncbi:CinA family protein [Nocardioides sp.]|uniref:CinA family protein n=1 Tax=Nocardioides sp. TaxID=35761 RepID=UPI00261B82B8|nr:CinA family protein [Nocardioides sp.]